MLSKEATEETMSDWPNHLTKVEFAINNTVSRSTGFTPSMLLFGINQKGDFCDKLKEHLINTTNNNDTRTDLVLSNSELSF